MGVCAELVQERWVVACSFDSSCVPQQTPQLLTTHGNPSYQLAFSVIKASRLTWKERKEHTKPAPAAHGLEKEIGRHPECSRHVHTHTAAPTALDVIGQGCPGTADLGNMVVLQLELGAGCNHK